MVIRLKCRAHLAALRIVVLLVQVAHSLSLQVVVSCTTVSLLDACVERGRLLPADILHCMVLVVVGVVRGRSFQSPVEVRGLPEEVDSLNSLGACLSISRHPSKEGTVEYTDSPAVVVDRSLVEEEARNLEVGEVHSPEAGIAVVEDSHVAGPDRERKT